MGCCAGAVVLAGAPRAALVVLWLFTDRLSVAFDSAVVGILGFVFLPYTTVVYVLVYAPATGVSTLGWALVVVGIIADISSWGGGAYSQRNVAAS